MRARLALAAGFAALAVAVSLGGFTWLDQFATSHWMTRLGPPGHHGAASILLPLTHVDGVRKTFADFWFYPASVPISGLIVLLCWRRLPRGSAWAGAWLVGIAIEVLVKGVLDRPALHQGARHIVAFDDSLPSGHTIRSLLVAAILARVFPRAGRWAWLWAASVWILLVAQGWHVPTDIAAGLLLGSLLALLADDLQRRRVDGADRPAVLDDREPVAVQLEPRPREVGRAER
jgi:membrane-associated phospholipid phosphatase